MMTSESLTGLREGRLQPCPPYPRCASTQSVNPAEFIKPLDYVGRADEILAKARKVMSAMKGSRLITAGENYLHFEFRTRLLRFVDDVEVYVEEAAHKVHFRSSSRIGYYDFKTNRHRIEEIADKLP